VRSASGIALGFIALGLLLNLGVLLVPAAFLGVGPRALGADVGLFLVGASALCLADLAGLGPLRPAVAPVASHDHRVLALAWAQGLAVLAVFWTGLGQRLSGPITVPGSVKVFGFVCMLAGALLRYAAIRALGARFVTEIHVGPELVRRGVYGRIRHPSETGLLLAAMGAGLLLSSSAAGAVFVVLLLPVVVVRTRTEDEALGSAFGASHDRYVREAGRFLPAFRSR
jgi:protein-S-isoprenylcysteine O-methyltransferase Ste14